MLTEPESLLVVVADVLDAAGIRYAVGGSVASSRFGEPRATLDQDVVVELTYGAIPRLVAALTPASGLAAAPPTHSPRRQVSPAGQRMVSGPVAQESTHIPRAQWRPVGQVTPVHASSVQ